MSLRDLAIAGALLLGSPALAQEAAPEAREPGPASPGPAAGQPEKPDCDGRNPFYCGVVVQNPDSGAEGDAEDAGIEKVLRPPGGCEGRNPLYCQELAPETPEVEEAERPGRGLSSPDSRNSRRNTHKNPNQNPRNRRRAKPAPQ